MKFIGEFRRPASARKLVRLIARESEGRTFNLMEVCGTHTVSIFRSGLRSLLPPRVRLVSGPGCPVCVTPPSAIDKIIAYARMPSIIIATFGDLLDVPGSSSSLRREKARGAEVRLIYSPLEAVAEAKGRPEKKVVLAAIGFETTMPAVAAALFEAKREKLKNFYVFSLGKRIPPAMEAIMSGGESALDGFLCPGHVTSIIGIAPYRAIARRFKVPCVVAGFEPLDILIAVYELIRLAASGKAGVKNLYPRAVRDGGNPRARQMIGKVFRVGDAEWRGLGVIPKSGFSVKPAFRRYDIETVVPVSVRSAKENPLCRCGDILRGARTPPDCPAFGQACTPAHPLGPCMVSREGTCSAWFLYR